MREFLRRCPSCGRRFAVRIRSKKITKDERESEQIIQENVVTGRLGIIQPQVMPGEVTLEQVSIERETFDVTYECRNCHHRWTETINSVKKG